MPLGCEYGEEGAWSITLSSIKSRRDQVSSVQWFSNFLVCGSLYTLKNYAEILFMLLHLLIFFAFEIENEKF